MVRIQEGQETVRRVVWSRDKLDAFAELTGDRALVHFDETAAHAMGYKSTIVHGFLVSSIYSEMLGCHLPGPTSVIQKFQVDLLAPVCVGEEITYTVRVTRVTEAVCAISLSLSAVNGDNKQVIRGSAVCILRK